MIEMTLSSRHRIRNSSPGGLRPSTLPLGHGGSPEGRHNKVAGKGSLLYLMSGRGLRGRGGVADSGLYFIQSVNITVFGRRLYVSRWQ